MPLKTTQVDGVFATQSLGVLERLHLLMGNMLRVQLVRSNPHVDPVKDMLAAAAYAIRSTVHGTTRNTPGQLVFNKDLLLRTTVLADMETVRLRRQHAISDNNKRENKRRIAHTYVPGDKVLILAGQSIEPKLALHSGPFEVLGFNPANGILKVQRQGYVDTIHMRLVRPYFGRNSGGE
jgi:hypothetical protein